MIVDRETGQVEIVQHTHPNHDTPFTGVKTPFGIMASRGTGATVWLWKTAWAEPALREEG